MEAHATGWRITDGGVNSDKIHAGDDFLELTCSLLRPSYSHQVRKLLLRLIHVCVCVWSCVYLRVYACVCMCVYVRVYIVSA